MALDVRIKLYAIVLLGFVATGVIMSLLSSMVEDNLLVLPLIGAVPIIAAAIFTAYWWFWGRKQTD